VERELYERHGVVVSQLDCGEPGFGCAFSHLSIMDRASSSAVERGPLATLAATSTPAGWIATDHCLGTIPVRIVYRMPL
jgi:hypothetical protein